MTKGRPAGTSADLLWPSRPAASRRSACGRGLSPSVLELHHGAWSPGEGPFVAVETAALDDDDRESLFPLQQAEEALIAALQELDPLPHDASMGAPEAAALRSQLVEVKRERALAQRVLGSTRERLEIPVDGRPVELTALHDRDLRVAAARIGDVDVSIRGAGVPLRSIELARVENYSSSG